LFEIKFFGTSTSALSIHRGLKSHIVMQDEQRLLKSTVEKENIDK